MDEQVSFELTEREKLEVRRLAKKSNAIYEYLDKEKLTGEWAHDTERFMAFTYGLTEALVKHSKTLSRWTKALEITTVVLALLAIAEIFKLFLFKN